MKVRITNKDMICLAVWHSLWQYLSPTKLSCAIHCDNATFAINETFVL